MEADDEMTPGAPIAGHCVDIDGNSWHKPGDVCQACGFGVGADPEGCPECGPGFPGWSVRPNRNTGEPEQEQCQTCAERRPAGAARPGVDEGVEIARNALITAAYDCMERGVLYRDSFDAAMANYAAAHRAEERATLQQAREAAEREQDALRETICSMTVTLADSGLAQTLGEQEQLRLAVLRQGLAALTAQLAEVRAQVEQYRGFETLSLDLGHKLRVAEDQLAEARADVIRLEEELADEGTRLAAATQRAEQAERDLAQMRALHPFPPVALTPPISVTAAPPCIHQWTPDPAGTRCVKCGRYEPRWTGATHA